MKRTASSERRAANRKKPRIANGEWWDPGRGGFSTRPAATWRGCRRRFQTRASVLGHPRMRCWTPISVGERGSVRNREWRMKRTANCEWRIANGEWKRRRAASSERRAEKNGELRIANSEWWMVLVEVGAGPRPAHVATGTNPVGAQGAAPLPAPPQRREMPCWTPISVGEQGAVKNGEWRMANGERWRVANGAGRCRGGPCARPWCGCVDAGMWGYGTQLRRSMLRLLFGRG
jgi:hypothetical protein